MNFFEIPHIFLLTFGMLFSIIIRRQKESGLVVQLVRTLACHARGRGFEPHPGRQHADIAQSVERILGKDEVGGSNPPISSNKKA